MKLRIYMLCLFAAFVLSLIFGAAPLLWAADAKIKTLTEPHTAVIFGYAGLAALAVFFFIMKMVPKPEFKIALRRARTKAQEA